MCHIQALCSWCTCMSATLGKLCTDVSFICFSGVLDYHFLALHHYVYYDIASVSISTYSSFVLNTSGNYRSNIFSLITSNTSILVCLLVSHPDTERPFGLFVMHIVFLLQIWFTGEANSGVLDESFVYNA